MFFYRIRKIVKNVPINIEVMIEKSYKKNKLVRLFSVCRDIRVLRIKSFVRYFLNIINILRF